MNPTNPEFKSSEYDPSNPEQQARITHVTNLAVALRNTVQALLIVGGDKDAPEHRADLHGAICMFLADAYPTNADIDLICASAKELLATLHPGQGAIPPTYVRVALAPLNPPVSSGPGPASQSSVSNTDVIARWQLAREVEQKLEATVNDAWGRGTLTRRDAEEALRETVNIHNLEYGPAWRLKLKYCNDNPVQAQTLREQAKEQSDTAMPAPDNTDKTLIGLLVDLATSRNYTMGIGNAPLDEALARIHQHLHSYTRNGKLPWEGHVIIWNLVSLITQQGISREQRQLYETLHSAILIYVAQMNTIERLKQYDLQIAGARSAKDRVVARGSKALILVSSKDKWGYYWPNLFGYDAYSNMPPIDPLNIYHNPNDYKSTSVGTTAAKEDAVRTPIDDLSPGLAIERNTFPQTTVAKEDARVKADHASQTAEAFRKEREIMNLTHNDTSTDDLVKLMQLNDELFGPNWREPFNKIAEQRASPFMNSQEGSAITWRKERSDDSIEPYLLSDADRDEMIPKQDQHPIRGQFD